MTHPESGFGGLRIIESDLIEPGTTYLVGADTIMVWKGHRAPRWRRLAWRLRHPLTCAPLVGTFREAIAHPESGGTQ